MKNLIDYQFQADAESRLVDMIVEALYSDDHRSDANNILFSSCVASGKTKMMASAMRQVAELEDDVAFIFMTLSKGQLDIQALADFREYGEDVVRYMSIDELVTEASSDGCVPPHTCTVIGWDSVGKDTNVQMRDGEKPTFRSIMQENKEQGRIKIALFVDEAHANMTWKGDAVKRLIHPYAIVMATATPRMKRREFAASNYRVIVEPDDVAAAGKIKNTVIVNDGGLDDANVLVSDFTWQDLISAGMRRRQLLEDEYRTCGLDVTPLVVVQLPNDTGIKGSDKEKREKDATYVVEAKRILIDKLGYNRSDIAVWTAKERDNSISDLRTNDIKVLVVKMAIVTGWDCPRAQVLVKLRHASQSSETLDMQTLGRFYRTTDPVAWLENESYRTNVDLNAVWIYCNDESYDPSDSGLNIQWNRLSAKIRPEFEGELAGIHLVRIVAGQRKTAASERAGIRDDIVAMLNDRMPFNYHQSSKWDYESRKRPVAQGRHGLEMWNQIADDGVSDMGQTYIEIPDAGIETYVNTRIKLNRSIRQYADIISAAVRKHVADDLYVGSMTFGEPDDVDDFEQKIVDVYRGINNAFTQDFVPSVLSIVEHHSHFGADAVYDGTTPMHPLWMSPKSTFLSNKPVKVDGNKQYDKYAYDMCSVDSNQEKKFVSSVLSQHTDWWFKNGTNTKDSFCIAYSDDNGNRKQFYPDFIAKHGKKLLILEVKGDVKGRIDNAIASDIDACKAVAVSEWLHSKWKQISIDASHGIDDIVFGIVKKINRDWRIYVGDGSDYADTTSSNWVLLMNLLK